MRWVGRIFASMFLLFLAMMIVNKIRFYYDWREAFFRTVMAPFEDTIWAPDFTLENFEKVRLSMHETEVKKILGEPLSKCDSDRRGRNYPCIWTYSWHVNGRDDFDQRWLLFDEEGKVVEIKKSFFID